MKNLFGVLLMVLVLGAGTSANVWAAEPGKVSPEDVKKQAGEALSAAKEYTMQEKQEYQKLIESQLADLSKKIEDLKAKAVNAKKDAMAALESQIADLKKKQEAAQQKLSELGSVTSKAWGEVKSGLDKAMDELKKAYEGARSKFD